MAGVSGPVVGAGEPRVYVAGPVKLKTNRQEFGRQLAQECLEESWRGEGAWSHPEWIHNRQRLQIDESLVPLVRNRLGLS